MSYTIPTCEAVNDVLQMYEGEEVVRRFLTEAENCITGAKEGPEQFLWGIYGHEERENADKLVEALPKYGVIWYDYAKQYVELERKNSRYIDLEKISKEFPHIEEIL